MSTFPSKITLPSVEMLQAGHGATVQILEFVQGILTASRAGEIARSFPGGELGRRICVMKGLAELGSELPKLAPQIEAAAFGFAGHDQTATLAGVPGTCMHEAVLNVAKKLLLRVSWPHHGPGPTVDFEAVVNARGFDDVWAWIEEGLRQFSPEDWEQVCVRLGNVYARAIAAAGGDQTKIAEMKAVKVACKDNEPKTGTRRSRRRAHPHLRTHDEMFKAALRKHHKYDGPDEEFNHEPASMREIEALTGNLLSDTTAGRLLKTHFGSVEQYGIDCVNGTIRMKLAIILGEASRVMDPTVLEETLGDVSDE